MSPSVVGLATSVSWVSSSVSGDTSHFDRDAVRLGSWSAVSFVSGEVAHHVCHHEHTADGNAKSCSGSPSLVESTRLSRVPWWTTKSLFFLVFLRTCLRLAIRPQVLYRWCLRRREMSLSVILVLVCSFANATELPLQVCMSTSPWQSLRPPCLRPTSSLQRLKTMRSELLCG